MASVHPDPAAAAGTAPRRVLTGAGPARPGGRRGAALAAAAVLGAGALTACGGSAGTAGGGGSSTGPGTGALLVERDGGIAGVRDVVRVAPDGSARVTARGAGPRACRPDPAAVARLRAVDLAAVPPAPSPPPGPVADGFGYTVSAGGRRVTVAQGHADGRRAEVFDAAAAVVTSCLADQAGS